RSFNVKFALFYLAQINVMLGLFNLLPAFPMDGGRILRAILASRLGLARGTRIAATLGKGFAALFALVGLFTFNFVLLFIAYFIYLGAEGEARQVLVKAMLGHTTIREMMTTGGTASVDADDTVARVAERMLAERRLGLPVVEGGRVVGVALLRDVQAVPPEQRELLPARAIIHPATGLSPDTDVWQALRTLEETGLPQLPVVEDGRLVGVLRRDDVARGLQFQELAQSQRHPRLPLRGGGEVPA
ncbi:MAG TPA: CBS domain-containing protein, partial [Myxococcaceae bacterium]|nr:CBS domain-containing protein [Myxococcaceae bacterium]